MDLSKAILKAYNTAIESNYKDIKTKIDNPNWVRNNNVYLRNGFVSNNVSFTINVKTPNAVFVAAELKKRFEAEGWRLQTTADDTNMSLTFNK